MRSFFWVSGTVLRNPQFISNNSYYSVDSVGQLKVKLWIQSLNSNTYVPFSLSEAVMICILEYVRR